MENTFNQPNNTSLNNDPITKDCMNCEWFVSFRDDYCDNMEPDDQGFCHNGKSKYFFNEAAGRGVVCEHHSYNELKN